MGKLGAWFWLTCKRYMRRVSFLAILLLLPAGTLILGALTKDQPREIRIALYDGGSGADALGSRLVQALTGRDAEDGMFTFYSCGSEAEVQEDVAARRAECGYVLPEDLEERLDQKSWKRAITVWSAPSTVAAGLSTEVVFAAMIELYDQKLLKDYVASEELFAPAGSVESPERAAAVQQSGELYRKWTDSGSTFHFSYTRTDADGTFREDAGSPPVFPVRGIAAVCVFITGLYAAVAAGTDARRGLFLPLPYLLRTPCRLACIAAPVCLSALSALLAVYSGGAACGFGYEAAAMAGYALAVTVFAWLAGMICITPQALCCTIPFFLIGSLVFCPIFLNTARLLPVFGQAARFFLPFYYLRLF